MFARKMNDRIFCLGSVDWDRRGVETLAGMIPNLKVEVLEPLLCKGQQGEKYFRALEDLAAVIA